MSNTNEHNVKINKAVCIASAIAFTVFVGSIAAYNIHANVYESQNIAAKTELVRAQMKLGFEQNEAIQDLISDGVNPIAARCAIVGWLRASGTSLCASFVRDSDRLRD